MDRQADRERQRQRYRESESERETENNGSLTDGHGLDVNQVGHLFVVCGATLLSLIQPHAVQAKGHESKLFRIFSEIDIL